MSLKYEPASELLHIITRTPLPSEEGTPQIGHNINIELNAQEHFKTCVLQMEKLCPDAGHDWIICSFFALTGLFVPFSLDGAS